MNPTDPILWPVWIMAVLIVAYLFSAQILKNRVWREHRIVWVHMSNPPTFFRSFDGSFRTLSFVFRFNYRKLNDAKLNRLVLIVQVLFVICAIAMPFYFAYGLYIAPRFH